MIGARAQATAKSTTFVVFAYNESLILERSLETLAGALAGGIGGAGWRILIADNGSIDNTAELAHDFVATHPDRAAYLSIPERGRGNALRAVARACPDATLCFLDADLPLDLAHLPEVLAPILEGRVDLVVGKRDGARPLVRTIMTVGWALTCRVCFGLPLSDPQCGVLALHPRASAILAKRTRETRWLANTEFLVAARRAPLRVAEVPIRWIDQRFPDRVSTVSRLQYIREGLTFLTGRLFGSHARLTAPIITTLAIGGAIAATLLYQLNTLAQDGFVVAHHVPVIFPKLRTYIIAVGIAFGVLGLPLFKSFRNLPWRVGAALLLMGTILIWAIALATPPTRSQDVYWNLAFGKIAGIYGENPYHTPPGVLTDDPWIDPIQKFRGFTFTHGPLWALTVAGIATLSGGSLGTALALSKALALLALGAAAWFLWRAFETHGVPREERIARMALVAWSPFLTQLALVDVHNDVFMLLGIIASYSFLLRGRHAVSALALVGAGFVKYVSFLLLPIPLFFLIRSAPSVRHAIKTVATVTATALLLGVVLYLPFGPPWENASGLTRQVFQTVNQGYATVPSLISAVLVGPFAVWYLGVALALAALVWYLTQTKMLHAYTAPLLALLATGTLWLQSWYLLWTLPLLMIAAPPALLTAYLSLGFIVPEGIPVLAASLVGIVLIALGGFSRTWHRPPPRTD